MDLRAEEVQKAIRPGQATHWLEYLRVKPGGPLL